MNTCFADIYAQRGMSRNYGEEIDKLSMWFVNRIGDTLIEYSPEQRAVGVDALDEQYKTLCKEAFDMWLAGGYELSYNQVCVAFFDAVERTWDNK